MKNIDKIRQMTADELAELLYGVDYTCCDECLAHDYCSDNETCADSIKQWLEQESVE